MQLNNDFIQMKHSGILLFMLDMQFPLIYLNNNL